MPDATRPQIGAEEAAPTEAVPERILSATDRSKLTAKVQANLRRSPRDVERLAAAGIPIRLVKGAYVEPPAVAWPYGEPTDLAYLALAERLADAGAGASIATHDGLLREACRNLLPGVTVEMLLGVRTDVARSLAGDSATAVRVQVPYGTGCLRCAAWPSRAERDRSAARTSPWGTGACIDTSRPHRRDREAMGRFPCRRFTPRRTDMTPAHTTSLLETSDRLARRAGVRGVDATGWISSARSARTMPENHTFSVPVVREMAPRPVSFPQTW